MLKYCVSRGKEEDGMATLLIENKSTAEAVLLCPSQGHKQGHYKVHWDKIYSRYFMYLINW